MSKVGIITYHQSINYGAILQAYALKSTLEKMGHDASIIDYRNKVLQQKHYKRSLKGAKSPIALLKYFLIHKKYNQKFDKFQTFNKKYLNLSKPVFTKGEVNALNYDYYITGSDQVWNTDINKNDWVYFLDGIDKNKSISYAASFGVSELDAANTEKYKLLFNDFNYITVRENVAVDLLTQLGIEGANTVLDPTLLLNKNEWLNKFPNTQMEKEKYILVYAFSGSKNIRSRALKYAKERNLKVKWIANEYKKVEGIEFVRTADPIDFLNLFYNAELIITNSFHGTAFSINFNKEFYVELLYGNPKVNSRIENILADFKLEERMFFDDRAIISNQIDFTFANAKLNEKRKESLDHLERMLK